VTLNPEYAAARRWDEAIAAARQAIALRPDHAEAHNQLARALRASGRRREAIEAYRAGIAAAPDYAPNYCHLAEALLDAQQPLEAMAAFRQALRVKPNYPEACFGLGNAQMSQGDLQEATKSYQRAIELRPDYTEAYNNLGNVYKMLGETEQSLRTYQVALAARPQNSSARNNLIMTMLYMERCTPSMILEEMKRYDEQHARPLSSSIKPHLNGCSPDRRLRIGYVSSDLCDHILARNILPLLHHHDHEKFEIFCYANVRKPDRFTDRCRAAADHWRDILGVDDQRAAQMIREDQIDILIDLAGHMGDTRLLLFAQKPAPVQVTFGGYPGGTGLATMDYRFTDPHLDPPGSGMESHYVEKVARLRRSWWCFNFQEMEVTDPVRPTPVSAAGYVTFGCLNSFIKISQRDLSTWKTLLSRIPNSRLMLLTPPGRKESDILTALAVPSHRIIFQPVRPRPAYLKLFHGIDIFLDTLPYNGHTTAMDALSMGVPVVTRPGATAVGRAGVSILTNLGLPDLIASNDEQYIQIATDLANDLPRLTELRTGMRQRMQNSPLMDDAGFARDIEAAYRQVWHKWCATPA
jgi:protein O-GlcNAc transferase